MRDEMRFAAAAGMIALGLLALLALGETQRVQREVARAEQLHQECRAVVGATADYAQAVRALTRPPAAGGAERDGGEPEPIDGVADE